MVVVHKAATKGQKTQGGQIFHRSPPCFQESVSGNLGFDKAIKAPIFPEGSDKPIAISPTPRILAILKEDIPFGVAIPGYIHPMTRPALGMGGSLE